MLKPRNREFMLGRIVIFSAWSFAMINLQPIVFWGCCAGAALGLMLSVLSLQSRHGSDVARFWLGVTFYGAPLPPVRLLWTSWFLHICGHDFQNRVSVSNYIRPLSKTLDIPILAQIIWVYIMYLLVLIFFLFFSQRSCQPHEARSELLT